MSHPFRPAQALAALAAFGALIAAAPAQAQALSPTPVATTPPTAPPVGTPNSSCRLSSFGTVPATVTAALPATVRPGADIGATSLRVSLGSAAQSLLRFPLNAATWSADVNAKVLARYPDGSELTLDVKSTTAGNVATAPDATLDLAAPIRGLAAPEQGSVTFRLESLALTIRAFKADGTPAVLITVAPDDLNDGVIDDAPCKPVGGDGTLGVVQVDQLTPQPTAPPAATPTPTPRPTPPRELTYYYDVTGQATLKTLTRGVLPLTGTALDVHWLIGRGEGWIPLAFSQTKATLTVLGAIPVVATVQFVPQGEAMGTLDDDGLLTLVSRMRLKLPRITFAGLELAGGSGCQVKNPISITLRSPGEFDTIEGGALAGTFSISDLTNCGALTGVISPLTAGPGNVIALKLTRPE